MNRYLILLASAILMLQMAACSTTPEYDRHFGEAVRQARVRMTVNPSAADPDPVAGMDGKSAGEAIGVYRRSFTTPPPVTNVINIGGAK